MTLRRDVTCACCGIVACAHLLSLTLIESSHPPRQHEAMLPYSAQAADHEHEHRDFGRSARLLTGRTPVASTSVSSLQVFGSDVVSLDDMARGRIA
jgi:hypothetical protein